MGSAPPQPWFLAHHVAPVGDQQRLRLSRQVRDGVLLAGNGAPDIPVGQSNAHIRAVGRVIAAVSGRFGGGSDGIQGNGEIRGGETDVFNQLVDQVEGDVDLVKLPLWAAALRRLTLMEPSTALMALQLGL